MIIYALIVRTDDGMALSASTDFDDEANKNLKESKKYVKMIANKASQLPERCILGLRDYNIFMVTSFGVSYLVMCDSHYSQVLAFSCLNELMKEFATKYESSQVKLARRPYHFIEFDNFIHKTRQRYNNPQSLTTRVNLSDLSAEMKLRPPYHLALTDIEPVKNGYYSLNIPQLGIGPPPKLEPLVWYAFLAMVPNAMLVLLGFYRGFSAMQVSSIEDYDGPDPTNAIAFTLESLFRIFQLYLLLYQSKYRMTESWMCLIVLLLLMFVVWDLRDPVQQILFIMVSIATHLCIITRKLQPKLPNYNV